MVTDGAVDKEYSKCSVIILIVDSCILLLHVYMVAEKQNYKVERKGLESCFPLDGGYSS